MSIFFQVYFYHDPEQMGSINFSAAAEEAGEGM